MPTNTSIAYSANGKDNLQGLTTNEGWNPCKAEPAPEGCFLLPEPASDEGSLFRVGKHAFLPYANIHYVNWLDSKGFISTSGDERSFVAPSPRRLMLICTA